MRVAVVGGTGTAGRPIVALLRKAGHEARALSRSGEHPVDLASGTGLADGLAGCEVVVDASNAGPKPQAAREVLVEGGRRLLAAAAEAGVRHHVCLSIVGIERVPLDYYAVKVEQEELVAGSGLPYSIVRATQFHQLVADALAGMARWRLLPGMAIPLQPVDPGEVAALAAAVAAGPPIGAVATIAGPETLELGELARIWRERSRRRAVIVPAPFPGKLGRALRAGGLTSAEPDHRGSVGFAAWLETRGR